MLKTDTVSAVRLLALQSWVKTICARAGGCQQWNPKKTGVYGSLQRSWDSVRKVAGKGTFKDNPTSGIYNPNYTIPNLDP